MLFVGVAPLSTMAASPRTGDRSFTLAHSTNLREAVEMAGERNFFLDLFGFVLWYTWSSRPNYLLYTFSTSMLIVTNRLLSSGSARSALARQAARACGASATSRSLVTVTGHNSIGRYTSSTSASSNKLLSARMNHSAAADLKESYEYILVERRFPEDNTGVVGGGVGIISLHRPKALNALCDALFEDLIHAVTAFDADDDIGCIIITGSGKAFAAGEYIMCMELL